MGSLDPVINYESSAKDTEITDDNHRKRQISNLYILIHRKKKLILRNIIKNRLILRNDNNSS